MNEFVGFLYGRKVGRHAASGICFRLKAFLSSEQTKSIISVLVGYFQLIFSVNSSFPTVDQADVTFRESMIKGGGTTTTTATTTTIGSSSSSSSGISPGSTGTTAAVTDSGAAVVITGLYDVAESVGNIDIFGTARCLTGARYQNTLLLYTAFPLGLILIAATMSQLVKLGARYRVRIICCGGAKKEQYIKPRSIRWVRRKKNNLIAFVAFLTYPISMRTILRTFLCEKLTNRTGHDEYVFKID